MSFASIPPSSQSAPVDEYIILWTADKHKKLKKWHDGYLRYHTFNKRLMVYDHLMNKVTDKFLPEDEPIDVGDELVFDSHLITIEDIKGRQSQDLRPLFEKTVDRRNKAKEDTQNRDRHASERPGTALSSVTNTPMRRAGTVTPAGRTPSLLKTVQSRPKPGGGGNSIYPVRPTTREPDTVLPPPVVPQKRTAQGPPAVQRIVYEKFNVPKQSGVETRPPQVGNATPSRTVPSLSIEQRNRAMGNDSTVPSSKGPRPMHRETPLPSSMDINSALLASDDDLDLMEIELEKTDFSAKSKLGVAKPPLKTRPNVPPPFRPPIAVRDGTKEKNGITPSIEQQLQLSNSLTNDLREPNVMTYNFTEQTRKEKEQATTGKSGPSVSRVQSIELISPPQRAKTSKTPTRDDQSLPSRAPTPPTILSSDEDEELPNQNSSATSPANGLQEILRETDQPKTLSLPSASSRSRRKLLCGPISRGLTSIQRPVSMLEIYKNFPEDDFVVDSTQPSKAVSKAKTNKNDKPAKKKVTKVIKEATEVQESEVKKAPLKKKSKNQAESSSVSATNNAKKGRKKPELSKETVSTDDEADLEPLSKNLNLSALGRNRIADAAKGFGADNSQRQILENALREGLGNASPEARPTNEDIMRSLQDSALPLPRNGKEKDADTLVLFSSDAEDGVKFNPKPSTVGNRSKKKAHEKQTRPIEPLASCSEDEFETLRSSGLPKHFLEESRNEERLRQRLADKDNGLREVQRIYRENEEEEMMWQQANDDRLKRDLRKRNLERVKEIQALKDMEVDESLPWSITPPERLRPMSNVSATEKANPGPAVQSEAIQLIIDEISSDLEIADEEVLVPSSQGQAKISQKEEEVIILSSQIDPEYSTAAFVQPRRSFVDDASDGEDEIIESSQVEVGNHAARPTDRTAPGEKDTSEEGLAWPKTGPWTIEACDLFDWRPPEWKFEGW